MLGADEMAEYEEARKASQTRPCPPGFTLALFSLWLAMLAALADDAAASQGSA